MVSGIVGIYMPNYIGLVIGGHGVEGPWLRGALDKITKPFSHGFVKAEQGDGTCSKKCNPQANKSWCMGIMNLCLEKIK